MHGPGIPSKIKAPSGEMNGVLRTLLRGFFRCRVARRRRKKQIHIPQQSYRPFFGMIFHSHGLSIPIRKDELHRLVRPRRPSGAVKCHPARLHVHFLLRRSVPLLGRPLRFRGALKVELHLAAADDASTHFFVLATLRMNCVVPLSNRVTSLGAGGGAFSFSRCATHLRSRYTPAVRLASSNAVAADQRAYFAASLRFMISVKQNLSGLYRSGGR